MRVAQRLHRVKRPEVGVDALLNIIADIERWRRLLKVAENLIGVAFPCFIYDAELFVDFGKILSDDGLLDNLAD